MATPRKGIPNEKSASALKPYRAKRNAAKTPEPMGDRPRGKKRTEKPVFVIQEHHARALHWDFRLEHEGVLVSWALPKGVPEDPKSNHLAVHTEDHPLDYGSFEGDIPSGEYGGGQVKIWDHGHFDVEKWRPDEVMVVLHGSKVNGRYVLFPTGGKNWMIHRMDPAPEGFHPLPEKVRPMLATLGTLPVDDEGWAFEIKWDGVRAISFIEGGRIRMMSRNDKELTPSFPEFRELGEFIGSRPCVLDGEIVVLGDAGAPDFGRLQHRLHLANANAVREAECRVAGELRDLRCSASRRWPIVCAVLRRAPIAAREPRTLRRLLRHGGFVPRRATERTSSRRRRRPVSKG